MNCVLRSEFALSDPNNRVRAQSDELKSHRSLLRIDLDFVLNHSCDEVVADDVLLIPLIMERLTRSESGEYALDRP